MQPTGDINNLYCPGDNLANSGGVDYVIGVVEVIIAIRGFQDKGKTALAVGIVLELCARHGYDYNEVVANIPLMFPVEKPPYSITNPQMKKYILDMVTKGLKHKIVLIDEADRVFPARFWQKEGQTEALIGLWQDYKLFNYVIYTAHEGTGVDVILRQVTQMELNPEYDAINDCIYFDIYNQLDGKVDNDCLLNVSKNIFPYYDRWKTVV